MRDRPSPSGIPADSSAGSVRVSLSPWVNERLLPLNELLSAHDVARLTRRPAWILGGLSLVGGFPKKATRRGRKMGWWRSDVLDWMSRHLGLADKGAPAAQIDLPLRRTARRSRRTCSQAQMGTCGSNARSRRPRSKRW